MIGRNGLFVLEILTLKMLLVMGDQLQKNFVALGKIYTGTAMLSARNNLRPLEENWTQKKGSIFGYRNRSIFKSIDYK